MNWLAHLYLSDEDAEARIGNILADVVKGKARKILSPGIAAGIRCHQAVDAFTDYHPRFGMSQSRIRPPFRRYAGIVIDVFYDHFLAKNWHCYSECSLSGFTQEIYQSLLNYPGDLPEPVRFLFQRMAREDWLANYRHLSTIRDTLSRISRRMKQPVDLCITMLDLQEHYSSLEEDFQWFFPELCRQVKRWKVEENEKSDKSV